MDHGDDMQFSLGKSIAWLGFPVTAMTALCLVVTAVALVRGFRARRRGLGTSSSHWWLGVATKAVLLTGVVIFTTRITAANSEAVNAINATGRTQGFYEHVWARGLVALPTIFVPCAAALLATIAAMVLGPPRDPTPGSTSAE